MTILDAALRFFTAWLILVLVYAWAGNPGVVCITPLAWLLALAVGLRVAERSSSPAPAQRIREAAQAGALLGLLQGLLFLVMVQRLGEIAPDEMMATILISAGMVCLGILVSAALAACNAWLLEQRKKRQQ
jgi:hypothetical protein